MKRTQLKRKTPLRPVNPERRAKRKAKQFGPQANLCRRLPCAACGRLGPSDPAHVISRGAGGGDRGNVIPLCKNDLKTLHEGCHQAQHQRGWGALYRARLVPPRAIWEVETRSVLTAPVLAHVLAWAQGYAQGLAVAAYGEEGK